MSFETITIERRQPVYDKKFIKVPGAEDGELPPLTIDEVETNLDTPTDGDDGRVNVLSLGRGRSYNMMPHYTQNLNMDFITYDVVGLDGNRVASGSIDDVQESIRAVARAKF